MRQIVCWITMLPWCAVHLLFCSTLGQSTAFAEPITPDAVSELFNKKDFTGLYTWLVDTKREDPRRVFTVTNGTVRISGEGFGYLGTIKEYRNYHLIAEFKWGKTNWPWSDRIGKARDSGIFLHATGPDGNSHDGKGAFMAAIECNVFQGATGDFLLIRGNAADGSLIAPRLTSEVADHRDADGWFTWQKEGRRQSIERWGRLNWFRKDVHWQDILDFRGAHDVESPSGEWTRVECICAGDRITVKVNGVVVNEAFDVYPRSGRILLQCEGSEIFFRRFELQPLKTSGRGRSSSAGLSPITRSAAFTAHPSPQLNRERFVKILRNTCGALCHDCRWAKQRACGDSSPINGASVWSGGFGQGATVGYRVRAVPPFGNRPPFV